MTPETLISEGQLLARPSVFLRPGGNGPVAAIWHERNDDEIEATGHRCWITVDSRFIPGQPKPVAGFLSVFTNESVCQGGRVEVSSVLPKRPGIELHASAEVVLPPIEATFLRGSSTVGQWLAANDWPRDERYNDNFPDSAVVKDYEREWFRVYPIYRQGTYAALGGWHWPCADDDWYQLVDEQLLVLTVHDSEPWVEAWRLRSGEFKVIQRIT